MIHSEVENTVGDVKKCRALEIRKVSAPVRKVIRVCGRTRRFQMMNGTMIDQLVEIVARAEEHAREIEAPAVNAKPELMPGFLYEIQQSQVMYGVA